MFAGKGFELLADFFLAPALPLSNLARIHLGCTQRIIIRAEVTDSSRVQARVFFLYRAAVQRLVLAEAAFQLEDDAVLPPLAILADVVGVQAGAMQGAIPTAEESLL